MVGSGELHDFKPETLTDESDVALDGDATDGDGASGG